jgi:hypothetical protein
MCVCVRARVCGVCRLSHVAALADKSTVRFEINGSWVFGLKFPEKKNGVSTSTSVAGLVVSYVSVDR